MITDIKYFNAFFRAFSTPTLTQVPRHFSMDCKSLPLLACNITIYVSGAQEKIQTLYTYEAERVIRVYQEYRRSIKQDERNARQVVVQQSAPAEDDVFTKLEKLNKLKEAGILTEEEFDEKKAELLAQM